MGALVGPVGLIGGCLALADVFLEAIDLILDLADVLLGGSHPLALLLIQPEQLCLPVLKPADLPLKGFDGLGLPELLPVQSLEALDEFSPAPVLLIEPGPVLVQQRPQLLERGVQPGEFVAGLLGVVVVVLDGQALVRASRWPAAAPGWPCTSPAAGPAAPCAAAPRDSGYQFLSGARAAPAAGPARWP